MDAAAPSNSTLPPGLNPLDLFPGVDVTETFGAVLIGTFVSLTLFGVNLHQTFRYFRLFPKDAPSLVFVVVLTFALEVLHTIMGMHICYYYLVESFFFPTNLLTGVWSIKLLTLNMGSVIVVSQCFFARRVYLIGGHQRFLAVITAILLMAELGKSAFATAATVETYIQVTFARFIHVSWLISAGFAMAVVADGTVAICLTYALRRSRANHTRTDSWLDVILVYTVNTGLLTSFLSIFSLIFATIYKSNLIYVGFNTVATRLYANSLMAVLNSRRSPIDKGIEGFETGSLGLALHRVNSARQTAEQWNVPQPLPPQPTVIDIKVTTEMVHDVPGIDDSESSSQKGAPLHAI
ncbi:hypothetical protein PYCCODRAFT_1470989 [Trametes coccinea BRFM310]|uniref:DUF6534 domain-containing protein n=1 Tax=Trametes coccinea (strain BRFM310) TaxID=1353009 RepID=A0A1Y2IDG8_TRAC3|nr:hypothetical protein PYCCODRAFT_1470989 [Trametes coccinea BRFM310]